MEVFATRYNIVYHLDKIINRQIEPDVQDYLIEGLLFNKSSNKYLNDYAISQCYYLVEFLNDPETFIKKHGKIAQDRNEYVKYSHPAFHIIETCERLNSDFLNVTIPERVRENLQIVSKIRSNIDPSNVVEEKVDELCIELNNAFKISPPLEAKEFIKIEKDTGPNMKIENDINELIIKTEELHSKTVEYLKLNPYILTYKKNNYYPTTFEEFIKYYETDYKSESFVYSRIFQDLHNFRTNFLKPVKIRVRYYAIAKLQGHFKFEKSVLELLGFKKCGKCSQL